MSLNSGDELSADEEEEVGTDEEEEVGTDDSVESSSEDEDMDASDRSDAAGSSDGDEGGSSSTRAGVEFFEQKFQQLARDQREEHVEFHHVVDPYKAQCVYEAHARLSKREFVDVRPTVPMYIQVDKEQDRGPPVREEEVFSPSHHLVATGKDLQFETCGLPDTYMAHVVHVENDAPVYRRRALAGKVCKPGPKCKQTEYCHIRKTRLYLPREQVDDRKHVLKWSKRNNKWKKDCVHFLGLSIIPPSSTKRDNELSFNLGDADWALVPADYTRRDYEAREHPPDGASFAVACVFKTIAAQGAWFGCEKLNISISFDFAEDLADGTSIIHLGSEKRPSLSLSFWVAIFGFPKLTYLGKVSSTESSTWERSYALPALFASRVRAIIMVFSDIQRKHWKYFYTYASSKNKMPHSAVQRAAR